MPAELPANTPLYVKGKTVTSVNAYGTILGSVVLIDLFAGRENLEREGVHPPCRSERDYGGRAFGHTRGAYAPLRKNLLRNHFVPAESLA
ncbi:MAG TPA: hypothetical protein VH280_13025 [Verrucomicrobiae bacterium]|jgi:hypothetical protein|nr:hypothetical protein [Verrucomicrobiae bacterium]